MLIAEIRDTQGNVLGTVPLAPKDFKTGSKGYWGQAQGARAVEDERLQVQVQAVIIGSKEASQRRRQGAAAARRDDHQLPPALALQRRQGRAGRLRRGGRLAAGLIAPWASSDHAPLPFHTGWTMQLARLPEYRAEVRAPAGAPTADRLEVYLGLEMDYIARGRGHRLPARPGAVPGLGLRHRLHPLPGPRGQTASSGPWT